MQADIIIRGSHIFDGTGPEPFSGGIAVQNHRILDVLHESGIEKYQGPDTMVIDAGDRLILPGFNDGHTHFTQGMFLEDPDFSVNLSSARSKEEGLQMVREFADCHTDNPWVYGCMMNNLSWKDQTLPTREDIDRVISDRPVILQMFDLHTVIANSCCMTKRGIDSHTENPADGVIERDSEGNLTGRFFDGASFHLMEPLFSPESGQLLRIYRRVFQKMRQYGITACSLVTPFGVPDDPLPFLEQLEQEGTLTTRVMVYPNINSYQKESFRKLQEKYSEGKIRIRGLKQLIDGVTGVFTAYLLEPYTNDSSTCGCTSVDMEEFRKQALEAIRDGVALRIHTIGDRAVREMLDIFEEGKKRYGSQGLRHVQEHLENVDPQDLSRFAELGICGCMQPWHILIDLEGGDKGNGVFGDKEVSIGKERSRHAWPMRELLDNGMILSLGSDYPVVGLEPMNEIYAGITRQTFDGKPEGGWYPEQCITLSEALKAYTWGSAYAEGMEQEIGTIEKGKMADLIVLNQNLFDLTPIEMLKAEVDLTIMDGKIVYDRSDC